MEKSSTLYVGLDVHKDSIDIAVADAPARSDSAAQTLADRLCSVVVLKGSGSVIAAPGQAPHINATGNAALASAGTGDVLAGWLSGRWAQAPTGDAMQVAFTTALQAVAAHGAAAEPMHPGALRAADLVERLHRKLQGENRTRPSNLDSFTARES